MKLTNLSFISAVLLPGLLQAQEATTQPASATSQPTSAASTQATSAPVSAPAKVPEAPKKTEEKPQKGIPIGSFGRVSFGGLFQGWYDSNTTADKFTENDEAINTFRIRRAELSLNGEIIPKVFTFRVMTDLAKGLFREETKTVVTGFVDTDGDGIAETPTTTTITGVRDDNVVPVRDLYGVIRTKNADLWFGQYKIPLSLEGVGSSAQLLFPERALVAKTFGDKRDFGVKVEKRFEKYQNAYYGIGVFNGSGENQLDTDDVKDLMWRFEAIPEVGHAKVLLAFVGAQSLTTDEAQAARRILEGDLRLNVGHAVLQSEFFLQHTRAAAEDDGTLGAEKDAMGFYASAGFQQNKVLVAARFGMLDPDTAVAPAEDAAQLSEIGASATYSFWFNKEKPSPLFMDHPEAHEAKIQVGYSHFNPTSPQNKATDEVIVALQSWF